LTTDFSEGLPQTGELIGGKWRVGEHVGEGGMGVVYRAQHDTLGRTVALKFLRPGELEDPESIARFLREAKVAGVADHPGIARVIDFAHTAEGVPYLVMEFLEGESLQSLLRTRETLTLATGLEILISVLETLQFIHDRDIVHRDLKPANIFCRRDGDRMQTKIFDFGIARSTSPGDALPHLTDRRVVVGTPYYSSPEQAQGHDVGAAADLWSVGVILYYMATGKLPFVGKTGMEVYAKVIMQQPPPPSTVNTDLPPSIDALVAKALAKPPLHRFASATVMAEALRSLAAEVAESHLLVTSRRHSSEVPNPLALETVRGAPPQLLRESEGPSVVPPEHPDEPPPAAKPKTVRNVVVAVLALVLAVVAGALATSGGEDGGKRNVPEASTGSGTSQPALEGGSGNTGKPKALSPVKTSGEPLTMVWTPYSDRARLLQEARWVVEEFERATRRPVKLVVPTSYDEAISQLLRGDAEFASLAPNSYVMAKARSPHLAMLARHLIDGGPSYQSLCVAMQASGFKSLGELVGKKVCFVDPASTSGFLYPKVLFSKAGVDIGTQLGKRIFAGDHASALQRMKKGDCATACVASSELQMWSTKSKVRMGALRILATSAPIPGDAIVMRHDLPDALKRALRRGAQQLIRRSEANEVPSEMLITGFVAGTDADYDSVRTIQKARAKTPSP